LCAGFEGLRRINRNPLILLRRNFRTNGAQNLTAIVGKSIVRFLTSTGFQETLHAAFQAIGVSGQDRRNGAHWRLPIDFTSVA
jgi:hypothetical protein